MRGISSFGRFLLTFQDHSTARARKPGLIYTPDVVFGCVVMPVEMLVCSSTWRPTAVQRHLRQQALIQLNSCQVEEKKQPCQISFC